MLESIESFWDDEDDIELPGDRDPYVQGWRKLNRK